MFRSFGLYGALAVVVVSQPLHAQALRRPLFTSVAPQWRATTRLTVASVPPAADSAHILPTHWVEGGLLGAAVVGAMGFLLASNLCDQGSCSSAKLDLTFVGAALGFAAGSLIGGQFPRRP